MTALILTDTSQPQRFLLQFQPCFRWTHASGQLVALTLALQGQKWVAISISTCLRQLLCFYNKSKRITPTQCFLSCYLGPIMTRYCGLETTNLDRGFWQGLAIIWETRYLRGHLQRYPKHSSCSQLSAFSPPRLQQSKRKVSCAWQNPHRNPRSLPRYQLLWFR